MCFIYHSEINQSLISRVECLLWEESLEKPLSIIYKALQHSIHEGLDKLLSCWREEMPELDFEDWEDIWEYPMQQLISARDRLINLKFCIEFLLHPKSCTGSFSPIHPNAGIVRKTLPRFYTYFGTVQSSVHFGQISLTLSDQYSFQLMYVCWVWSIY